MRKLACLLFISPIFACSCNDNNTDKDTEYKVTNVNVPANLQYTVLNMFPHDTAAFTQGLIVYEGKLLEGTGAAEPYTSSLRLYDISSGKIEKKVEQGREFFGEGITIFNNKLYQLTWKDRKIFVYDPQSLKKLAEYPWEKPEGWGITHNDTSLIVSDGTSNIYLVDPVSLKITRTIPVTDNNGPVNNINELEYIRGFVYANQWGSDYVLKIDLSTGVVVGKADFTGILARYANEDMNQFKYRAQNAVLNGIAYDPATNRTFITGKLWPVVFEIKFE